MQNLPILYSFRRCPYAMRARIALLLMDIPVELREVELKNKPEEMLKLSPKGTVPVLQLTDGSILEESLDVVRWALEINAKREAPLQVLGEYWLSDFTEDLALIKECDEIFTPILNRYKYHVGYPEHSQEYYRDQATEFLKGWDTRLTEHAFLLGESASLADIAIFPFVRQFALVDDKWFWASVHKQIIRWLDSWLESKAFTTCMTKYSPWQPASEGEYFSLAQQ